MLSASPDKKRKGFITRIKFAATGLALAIGMLSGAGRPGHAASCSAYSSLGDPLLAGSPGELDTSDLTFRGREADGCSGLYLGNDSPAEVRTVAAQLGSAPDALQPLVKADGAAAANAVLYDGILWSVSYESGSNYWSLSYSSEPELSNSYDLIVVLKQAGGWAVFRFADQLLATDDTGGGTFQIDWCRRGFGCSSEELSHLGVYLSRTERFLVEPTSLALIAAAALFIFCRLLISPAVRRAALPPPGRRTERGECTAK